MFPGLKCPVCAQAVDPERRWLGNGLKGYWECEGCGSRLCLDRRPISSVHAWLCIAPTIVLITLPLMCHAGEYLVVSLTGLGIGISAVLLCYFSQRVLSIMALAYDRSTCLQCRYSLEGLTPEKCPECGWRVPPKVESRWE